jgi:uncharacterized protein with GYD domain
MKFSEKQKLHGYRNNVFESGYMPTYILLSTLTAEGRKTIKEKPSRIQEVNKEIEAFGAKVVSQYAVLGPYDFVNVVEAPDNETITRVSVELGARGTVQIMSMPAIPIDKFIAMAKKK